MWNVAIFLVSMVLSFQKGVFAEGMTYLSLNPFTWGTHAPYFPVWQLVTYGFLHSVGSLSHLAFNMLALYFFGTLLEQLVGSTRMAVTYFGAMVAGGVLHLLASMLGSPHPAIGASGAVLGVIVAVAVLRPQTPVIFLIFPMTLKVMAMLIVGLDAFMVIVALRDGMDSGVAHWVHLGGALFGFLWARKGWIWIDFPSRWTALRAQQARQTEQDEAQRMDDLLAKIARDGIASLSQRERDFLKRMSERKR